MAVLSINEGTRLAALFATNLLDSAAEERFDRITRLASQFFDVPIALVSLVDSDRQWFKSRQGLEAVQTPRSVAFCAHAILQTEPLVVADALRDDRFKDNPLVTGAPFIRFYAGHPVFSVDGLALGTLCILDHEPRQLTSAEVAALRDFAALVTDQIGKELLIDDVRVQQRQLYDSEIRFAATFAQAAVGIAHIGLDGSWLRVNAKLCDIVGYSAEEIQARSFRDITFHDDVAACHTLTAELLQGKRSSYTVEVRYIHQTKRTVWVNLTVSLVHHAARGADYFVAVIEDIEAKKAAQLALQCVNEELEARVFARTAELQVKVAQLASEVQHRTRTEATLRASETRIRTILDNSLDAFIGIDANGRIIDWNRAAESLFGWQRESVIGSELTSTIIPLQHQAAHRAGIERTLKTGGAAVVNRRIQLPARTRSGTEIPVEMTISAYQIEGELFFASFLHDISERLETARKLEQKQQLLDAVLETIDVGVVACSSVGELTLFNRAARAFHGLPLEAIDATDWARHYALFAADGTTHLRKNEVPLFRALSGETVVDAEMVIAPADHKPYFLVASGKPLMSSSGEPLGAVVAMKDITDSKEAQKRLAFNEQRLRSVTENLPTLIGHIDQDEKFLFLNSQATRFYGKSRSELIGRSVRSAYSEADYQKVKPYIDAALAGRRASFEDRMTVNGNTYYYHAAYIPDKDASGTVNGFYAMAFDITARKVSELAQAESEERLRTIANNLPVLIAYLDHDLRYQFANASYDSWLGVAPAEMLGKTVAQLFGTDFFEERKDYLLRCLNGETVRFEIDSVIGEQHRSLESIYIPHMRDGAALGLYILTTDITKSRDQEKMLQQLARADALTGLPNRRCYDEKLRETLLRSARTGHLTALMFIDIDFFKQINDTLGHGAGDELLKEFGARLARAVRATDVVSRLAGDEFTIILEDVASVEEAAIVADKILAAIRQPFHVAGVCRNVTTSIGIACTGAGHPTTATLTKSADDALYRAKAAGRNCYCLETMEAASR
jgi:diguanylate cyclase (GGDEF)-like protein/PAS domain S-box-containing protein